eukprot:1147286-Pelagomonas_calceolata.AAC.1
MLSSMFTAHTEQALRNIRKEPLGPLKALQDTPFKHCTSAVPCEFWVGCTSDPRAPGKKQDLSASAGQAWIACEVLLLLMRQGSTKHWQSRSALLDGFLHVYGQPKIDMRHRRRQGHKEHVWTIDRTRDMTTLRTGVKDKKDMCGQPAKDMRPCLPTHCLSAHCFHPGQTCAGHAVGILPHAYARALGIYLPVYLVPALLVHRLVVMSAAGG